MRWAAYAGFLTAFLPCGLTGAEIERIADLDGHCRKRLESP